MPALLSELRRRLESVCIQARELAETAARSALQKRAVDTADPHLHFTAADKELRNRLRARGRQVGDVRHANKKQDIDQLTKELAYEYWHRMLFARFLAENNLLMHPDGVAVSLEECEELAKSEKAPNGFVLAARYASRMLPQVFRTDDVLLEIEFAPEHRLALEKLLASLPRQTFLADDSLGWVYQFWQSAEKDRVNQSGDKIDGRTLPAVTQLFTEDYMVQFLLHNTIGAWWCARHGIKGPPGSAGVPPGKAPVEMPYLRWREDGTPTAGSYEGWPTTLKEFKMLDPCCGSGHFLVNAFNLLVPLRMHDEGLSAKDACDAVLRENIFGLELDPRCTQIAAFALALAAWKHSGENAEPLGYRGLSPLNIACSGQGVTGKKEEWLALANADSRLHEGMERLFDLFRQAPHLGSLIDPRKEGGDMFVASFGELQPLLDKAMSRESVKGDVEAAAIGVAAKGIATAGSILGKQFTLVATNVPYLARGKQHDLLKDHCSGKYPNSKADLATTFVERCLAGCIQGGTIGIVCPQNWLFQGVYQKLRIDILKKRQLGAIIRLGPAAFHDMNWWAAKTQLIVIHNAPPLKNGLFSSLDVSPPRNPDEKAQLLKVAQNALLSQQAQVANPDSIITAVEIGWCLTGVAHSDGITTLSESKYDP
jgi:hypothetical protein